MAKRLWRLRKLHDYVDAELLEAAPDGAGIQFYYNGELTYTRLWPTRTRALEEAAAKRAELERQGWTFHW